MLQYEHTLNSVSLFSLAGSISQGNSVIWFVNRQAEIVKFEIESELLGKYGVPLFYNKTNIQITSFAILNEDEKIEDKQIYKLGNFFDKYSTYGFLFLTKKDALRCMLYYIKNTNIIKNPKAIEYVKRHPEYFI